MNLALGVQHTEAMTGILRTHRSWLGSGTIFLVLAVSIAALACLYHDGDMDHHAMPPDLCLGLLVVSLTLAVLGRPPVVGWALVLPPAPAYVTTIHIPDPPPKPRSLA